MSHHENMRRSGRWDRMTPYQSELLALNLAAKWLDYTPEKKAEELAKLKAKYGVKDKENDK